MEKEKILVIDDDESVLEYLKTALQVLEYDVTAAATATEALGKIKTSQQKFPVVLSDIMLPGIDGIELLRRIKKENSETIVIMLTAHASVDYAVKSLNEGAFGFLAKPINIDELKSILKNAFEKYHLLEEKKFLMDELKKSKDYLETIVQNLIYVVIATDSNGYIKKTNKAVETLLGYKEEELIGAPIQVIFSQQFKQAAWAEMINKGRVKDFPVSFLAKDGREVKVSFTGTVMKDISGNAVGFLGTAQG